LSSFTLMASPLTSGDAVACSALSRSAGLPEPGQRHTLQIPEPCLTHIVSGKKLYEGRLRRRVWKQLVPGDCLIASSEKFSNVELIIRDVLPFKGFNDAFKALGKELLPEGAETPDDAEKMFEPLYSYKSVQRFGVVAFKIEVNVVKPVSVRIQEPWLSHIVSGRKLYEGRLRRGMWKLLVPGDSFIIASSENFSHVELIVRDILPFSDFGDAFKELGKHLLPEGAETPDDALAIYRKWYSIEDVQACGVVALKIEVQVAVPCPSQACGT